MLLLVEDEPLIQVTLETALADAGFELVACESGGQALEELEANHERIQGLITDIRLGNGPDGWAVAHRAREILPGIPVVYISGDSAAQWSASGVPNSVMISKPFALAQMVTAISTLLNDAGQVAATAGPEPQT